MSYDVTVGEESFNYTSNVSKLWYDHIDGGLADIHGKTGAEVAVILANSFARLRETYLRVWESGGFGATAFNQMYDAPNGWGSTVGAIIFIGEILAACLRNPTETVHVSR